MLKAIVLALSLLSGAAVPLPKARVPFGAIAKLQVYTPFWDEVCTAFSINKDKGYWVTTAHCGDDLAEYYIQDEPVKVVKVWPKEDLMILEGSHVPALRVAQELPLEGTPVYKWGYGRNWPAWISEGKTTNFLILHLPGEHHMVWMLDLVIRGGDSGAPIMTYDNQVVSVAEIYWDRPPQPVAGVVKNAEGGLPTPILYELLEPYLPTS